MTGEDKTDGDAMQKGIQMAIDRAEKEGILKEKRIELLFFNDQKERSAALKTAIKISENDQIIFVLGNYYSLTSEIAGPVYRKNGIPVITASATLDSLTIGNEFFFRVIPNTQSMVTFASNYMKHNLKNNQVSIIYDKDGYGSGLMNGFEKLSKELGIEIINSWGFDRENKNVTREIKEIISRIRTINDPGILFFATHPSEAIQMITSLKYEGTQYTIIGPDSFASPLFIEAFNHFSNDEKVSPGYYTNGIYAISPFLLDMGDEESLNFSRQYLKNYGEKPSWIASCYYDAMWTALNALERIDMHAVGGDVRDIRRRLRDRLAMFNSEENSVKGITGKLFFDTQSNVNRVLHMGMYQNQVLLPSFQQYEANNTYYLTNSQFPNIQVVYSGIDINEIGKLVIKDSDSFSLDFFIWFRFQDEFDVSGICFPDALTPIQLDIPIRTETIDHITTKTYRVKTSFHGDFDLSNYPFDQQTLP
ncbi:MAG: ABC transporter substrate-binding protein, partial [Desulfobacterales bacterium]|nr:ABC transporter substrate-binding protein [Desulfobacterales bacterium]